MELATLFKSRNSAGPVALPGCHLKDGSPVSRSKLECSRQSRESPRAFNPMSFFIHVKGWSVDERLESVSPRPASTEDDKLWERRAWLRVSPRSEMEQIVQKRMLLLP